MDVLREGIETVNQNRPPLRVINGYAVLEHLGSGAFGSVFKVSLLCCLFELCWLIVKLSHSWLFVLPLKGP